MPSDYSNTIYSYFIRRKCMELNSYRNYLIYPNIGYTIIDKKIKEEKKVICENKNFQIDQEKFNTIVKKSFNK